METRLIASLQGLTNFHIHDAIPITTHYNTLVFGLAFIDTLDDESDMVDLLSFDGLVFVIFPSTRKRETRVVHLARVFREVIAQDVVDAPEWIRAGLGQFAGPELYLLAV